MTRDAATHHLIGEVFLDKCGIGGTLTFVRAKGIVATTIRRNALESRRRSLTELALKGSSQNFDKVLR